MERLVLTLFLPNRWKYQKLVIICSNILFALCNLDKNQIESWNLTESFVNLNDLFFRIRPNFSEILLELGEIYNFRMGRFSGMEIFSSPGLKNPQKLAQGRKILSSQGP